MRIPDVVRPSLGVVLARREALLPDAERQLEGDERLCRGQRRRGDGRDALLQLDASFEGGRRERRRRHANRGQA